MESYSKIYGEECQSSESGWTMRKTVAKDDDVDTDDSMASDASSGPELKMSSSSSDENKKMKSMIEDDDEIKATDKLRSVTYWGSLQMRRVADDMACRCREIMALEIQVQPKILVVAVASEEARALEVVAVARLLNFFVEALCKVRGEIDVEFRDEANAVDPYKVVVLVG
nr:hypothetical protein [Tanacetum cinerariifolium]